MPNYKVITPEKPKLLRHFFLVTRNFAGQYWSFGSKQPLNQ